MPISAETKAAMRANLELEVTARKEKLMAMCEAQCASLRSRLERRVNRVPSNKRTTRLIDILEPPPPKKTSPVRTLEPETVTVVIPPVTVPIRAPAPVPAPAAAPSSKRSRAATTTGTTKAAPKAATKAAPKVAPKTSNRTLKRSSDEISVDDKENNADVTMAKKKTKTTAAPRATRATRAMSKKGDPPQVLSPKPTNTGNARPAATRARRVR